MPLKLNSIGGGSVTLDTPSTASNLTFTLPSATSKAAYADSSDNLQVNSGYGSYATGYVARAWVNFNGTGTVAIRASGNVSSITDNGTGDYTVNFTSAMPDANYSVSGAFMRSGAGVVNPLPFVVSNGANFGDTFLVGSVKIICSDSAATRFDPLSASVSIFR